MNSRLVEETRRERFQQLVADAGGPAKMADRLGKTASYVSQLVSGHRNIGRNAAKAIEESLDLPPNYLDHPDDFGIASVGDNVPRYGHSDQPAAGRALVVVPSFTCQADAGRGRICDEAVEVPGGFVFKRASPKKAGLLGKQLTCIFASGHSMEPTIADGDLLLLNHGHRQIDNGAVYAIRWGSELRCKRLFWTADQRLLVRSDNPEKARYPDETVHPDQEGLEVLAHVCWRGGWI